MNQVYGLPFHHTPAKYFTQKALKSIMHDADLTADELRNLLK